MYAIYPEMIRVLLLLAITITNTLRRKLSYCIFFGDTKLSQPPWWNEWYGVCLVVWWTMATPWLFVGHVRTCVGAAPDGDADALAGMLLAVMSLERSTAAQPSWLDEARYFCWKGHSYTQEQSASFYVCCLGTLCRGNYFVLWGSPNCFYPTLPQPAPFQWGANKTLRDGESTPFGRSY